MFLIIRVILSDILFVSGNGHKQDLQAVKMAIKSVIIIFISGLILIHYNILIGTNTHSGELNPAHFKDGAKREDASYSKETDNRLDNIQINMNLRSVVKRDANAVDADFEKNVTFVDGEDGHNVTYTMEQILEEIRSYIYPTAWMWVLICFHCIVFVVGLVGNTLVCVAVYRNHTMRTVTNYFIVNLAVADFLVILFCLPPSVVWDVTSTWFFGVAMCKVVLYLQVSSKF